MHVLEDTDRPPPGTAEQRQDNASARRAGQRRPGHRIHDAMRRDKQPWRLPVPVV